LIELLLLSLALSMDAFAVSLGLGARFGYNKRESLRPALSFGIFQGIMPLLGFFVGVTFIAFISAFDHYLAFGILALIGAKMIYEGLSQSEEERLDELSHRTLLILSIATSIDALAAGVSLHLIDVNVFLSCTIIAFTTFLLSYLGVLWGKRAGEQCKRGAEILGGVILIGIGSKILLEHLFF